MRLIFACLLLVLSFGACAVERLKTEADARALGDRMMQVAMTQSPDAAFSLLKPYWPMDQAEIDGLASNAKLQWQMIESRFGKPLGFELVSTERIGTSFVRFVYLQRFEKHALRWEYTFYRPTNEGWLANSFKFNDELDALYRAD